MKIISYFIVLGITLAACNQNNSHLGVKKDIGYKNKASIIDSLNKYAGSDSLFENNLNKFYVGRANNLDFAFVQTSDSTTRFLQKNGDEWETSANLNYPLYYVHQTDLNGDRYKDLVLVYFVTGSGANAENISLLYNPKKLGFFRNTHYDLPNISYDKKSNLVCTAWWASSNNPQEKQTYKISGDSLTFYIGVEYEPDEEINGDLGTVEFYRMKVGKRIVTKKVKGDSESIYNIFSRSLWDTSNE